MLARLAIIAVFIVGLVWGIGSHYRATPFTLYMPQAEQGSQQSLCLSNQTGTDIAIAHGPTLHSGETVAASVVYDFEWGFENPVKTDRHNDGSCFVLSQ